MKMNLPNSSFVRPLIWEERGTASTRFWLSESDFPLPQRVLTADERLTPEEFHRAASEGTAFVWLGDFHKAKDLLHEVNRRLTSKPRKQVQPTGSITDAFQRHRQAQAQRALILSRLLIPIDRGGRIPLQRAPDVRPALEEAIALPSDDFLISLRELLGMIGAHEWRKKGVPVAALGASIHPYYGVFSPVRGEYLELIAKAPLPSPLTTAFDIGTGTGVIAAILASRGVAKIIATDMDPRALACARENLERLGFEKQAGVVEADLFPPGQADLLVCNPPWLPGRPTARIERAVYDEDSAMLRGFLTGAAAHLTPQGEAWLVISDLAEILGLRKPDDLRNWIRDGGLQVLGRLTTRPRHTKATDANDPLFAARSKEVTSLWRLGHRVAEPLGG